MIFVTKPKICQLSDYLLSDKEYPTLTGTHVCFIQLQNISSCHLPSSQFMVTIVLVFHGEQASLLLKRVPCVLHDTLVVILGFTCIRFEVLVLCELVCFS